MDMKSMLNIGLLFTLSLPCLLFSKELNIKKKIQSPQKTSALKASMELITYSLDKKYSGMIPVSKADLVINNNKIDSGNFIFQIDKIKYSEKKIETMMKSDDFFEVSVYPTAKMEIIDSKKIKENKNLITYLWTAKIEIKGLQETMSIQAEVNQSGNKVKSITFDISDRTVFDLKFNSKKYTSENQLGENIIDDKVSFRIKFD